MSDGKPSTPHEGARDILVNGIRLVGALLVLGVLFGDSESRAWILGFVSGTISGAAGEPPRADPALSETPTLRLLGHSCRQEYGYQTCEGEVRNVSAERLENVMVVVRFKDKAGGFIKAQDALIDYQPLMPNQTSPFKVGVPDNPLIRHYTIGFRQMFGGELKASRQGLGK